MNKKTKIFAALTVILFLFIGLYSCASPPPSDYNGGDSTTPKWCIGKITKLDSINSSFELEVSPKSHPPIRLQSVTCSTKNTQGKYRLEDLSVGQTITIEYHTIHEGNINVYRITEIHSE